MKEEAQGEALETGSTSGSASMKTAAMVRAFVPPAVLREWLRTLRQIREAEVCPCTLTTTAVPSMGWRAGRPVSSCGLCYGLGAQSMLPGAYARTVHRYPTQTEAPCGPESISQSSFRERA